MYDLPLPREIQNLVAAYLNPIFHYVEYTNTIKKYNQSVEHFEGLPTQKKQALVKINQEKKQDLVEKLEEKYEIIIISPQQLQYLKASGDVSSKSSTEPRMLRSLSLLQVDGSLMTLMLSAK